MHNLELIGLDIGQAKTGLARASTEAGLAEPLVSVDTAKLKDKLKEIIKQKEVEAIVIGLPRSLDGNDTDQTRWVRVFVRELKSDVKASYYWLDEALTTVVSEKLGKSAHDDHALAASVILQDWIDTDKAERVLC